METERAREYVRYVCNSRLEKFTGTRRWIGSLVAGQANRCFALVPLAALIAELCPSRANCAWGRAQSAIRRTGLKACQSFRAGDSCQWKLSGVERPFRDEIGPLTWSSLTWLDCSNPFKLFHLGDKFHGPRRGDFVPG
ncbi:unnamed protein product [Heterotrigona itama]|uniref:Uncharacterized protein n=1 Tax=Heterotrigona itama TaxID=395501 RepID=A0A6V7HNP1_9HYME|nr:unnamed protein product [Heterotrigona itama]